MATIKTVQHFDDLTPDVEAQFVGFTFGIDGREYAIDLGVDNHQRLIETLAPYVAASRRVRPNVVRPSAARPNVPAQRSKPDPEVQERNRTIRAWAAKRGFEVKDRGHIPTDVVRAYEHEIEGGPAGNGHAPKDEEPASGGRIAAIRARMAEERGVPEETLKSTPEEEEPEDAPATGPVPRNTFASRADMNRAIRVWAKGKGVDVPPKGRIPSDVMLAWTSLFGEPVVVA